MGLLDLANNDQLMLGLGLMQAGAAKPVRTGLGEGLLSSLMNLEQMKAAREDRAMKLKQQALQEQQLAQQIASQKFHQQQLEQQMARQNAIENLPGQFMTPGIKPDTMDNRDVGQPGERPVPSQGFDMAGYANAMFRYDPKTALALQQSLRKDTTPVKLGAGETLLDPTTFKPLASNPKEQTPDEFEKALKLAGIDPASPQGRQLTMARLQKMATHQPGVSVSYGAPVAGVDAKGNPVFFQPSKDGGAPSLIPGVAPPKKSPPVEFTKSVAGLNELENGLASYEATLKENGGVSPLSSGATRANLQGAYTSLQMGLKNAFELGALAGPDLSLLQGMLVDPTSPRAVLLGDKGVSAQINKAREYLKNRRKAVYQAHDEPLPQAQQMPANIVNFSDLK